MVVEIFTIADFAQNYQGKLFINGTFDNISSRQFPVTQPNISIILKLRFDEDEIGLQQIKIKIIHSNGQEDFLNMDLNVAAPPLGLIYSSWQEAFNISNYVIHNAGTVKFELYVNNDFKQDVSINIIQIQ